MRLNDFKRTGQTNEATHGQNIYTLHQLIANEKKSLGLPSLPCAIRPLACSPRALRTWTSWKEAKAPGRAVELTPRLASESGMRFSLARFFFFGGKREENRGTESLVETWGMETLGGLTQVVSPRNFFFHLRRFACPKIWGTVAFFRGLRVCSSRRRCCPNLGDLFFIIQLAAWGRCPEQLSGKALEGFGLLRYVCFNLAWALLPFLHLSQCTWKFKWDPLSRKTGSPLSRRALEWELNQVTGILSHQCGLPKKRIKSRNSEVSKPGETVELPRVPGRRYGNEAVRPKQRQPYDGPACRTENETDEAKQPTQPDNGLSCHALGAESTDPFERLD